MLSRSLSLSRALPRRAHLRRALAQLRSFAATRQRRSQRPSAHAAQPSRSWARRHPCHPATADRRRHSFTRRPEGSRAHLAPAPPRLRQHVDVSEKILQDVGVCFQNLSFSMLALCCSLAPSAAPPTNLLLLGRAVLVITPRSAPLTPRARAPRRGPKQPRQGVRAQPVLLLRQRGAIAPVRA